MISVVLVPIVKNKSASICSKSNYRPIALASIVSKVLEKLIYDRIAVYLNTCSNQFGFKAKHSTDMTIYALKEAVPKYRSLNSKVYSCFLDASKAFDRVNHYVLFHILVKRGVPLYKVRILVFWYNVQKMYIGWNNTMSDSFSVINGVCQGGIISPYLFCVYMDDLSKKLNNVNAGCFMGTALINNLMYADDLVILAPSHVVVCQQSRLDVRKYSFSQRTISVWNKLSTDCVHASSVNMFKNKIDKYLAKAGYT